MVISDVKTWVNDGWIDDCSRGVNMRRIFKFENLPKSDQDSKLLEQEWSRSYKK